jgi:hypothetical protein
LKKSAYAPIVLRQIAKLLHAKERQIKVLSANVQQQSNGVDCGLYAIAFATEVAFGFDPSEATFLEEALRSHILKCFQDGKIERFPQQNKSRVVRCKKTKFTFDVYCICRDIFLYEDVEKDKGMFMAMCSMC